MVATTYQLSPLGRSWGAETWTRGGMMALELSSRRFTQIASHQAWSRGVTARPSAASFTVMRAYMVKNSLSWGGSRLVLT